MKIQLNGEASEEVSGSTLAALMKKYGLMEETTVAEINGVIIYRGQFNLVRIKAGDRVELLKFVGGG
jgi:thiamine biosynthesis protein ThiS